MARLAEIKNDELTEKIIGCAITVNRTLGSGFLERVSARVEVDRPHRESAPGSASQLFEGYATQHRPAPQLRPSTLGN